MMISTREEEGNEHVQNANSAFAYRPNEASYSEPIITNSGLLLTHRRPAPVSASSQSASIAREQPISPSYSHSHRGTIESPQNHAYAFNDRGGGSPSNNRYRNNTNNTTPYYRDPSSPQSNSNPPWQTFSVVQDMRRENRMLRNVRLAVIGLTCMFLFVGFGLIHRHHSNELDRVNNNNSASTNLQQPDRTDSKTIISSQTKSHAESESNTSNNISTPLFQSSEHTPTLTKNNIHQDIAEDVPITRLRPLPVHMQPLGNNDVTEIQMPKEELYSPHHEHHRKMKNVKKVDSSNFHFPHLDWNTNNNVKNRQEEKRHEKEKHDKMNVVGHLREEFEEWIKEHSKSYHSEKEKEKRFKIWSDNHHR